MRGYLHLPLLDPEQETSRHPRACHVGARYPECDFGTCPLTKVTVRLHMRWDWAPGHGIYIAFLPLWSTVPFHRYFWKYFLVPIHIPLPLLR